MTRRLAAVLFACILVMGCGKTNDPPAGGGGGAEYAPKDNVKRRADVPVQSNTTRTR